MLRSIPYGALAVAILGQWVAHLFGGALGAFAVPCCDDPTPLLPRWYAEISTPIHFLVMLLPAFLCGLYANSRPILVGALAAGIGALLWHWIGGHVLANLFPARALGGMGDFKNALWVFAAPGYLATLIVSATCYAAAGAGAASGGYLLRDRVRPNTAFDPDSPSAGRLT